MIFNSFEYFVFFVCVIGSYYCLRHKWQNRMLLIASYFFYGWWDWRFLFLILLSTIVDFFCGKAIFYTTADAKRKYYIIFSIITNLSILGFFKYWNFFSESLKVCLNQIGFQASFPTLSIILPVGISFYTFQTMTYSIDIYRGRLKPTEDFLDFALFVSFFPQLVAGPIERAGALLPQIENKRYFNRDQFVSGLYLIFWGLFMKVFVADNLGLIVNDIYGNPESTGFDYIIGTWAFAFQILGDFSGYTDIARGSAKCLGIELMLNFKQPYFASNPSEFWHRWHISLSTWLRDYLYISLGGNRKGRFRTYCNLMITMFLGGLWHGAAWHFIVWGTYHGFLLGIHRFFKENKILAGPFPSRTLSDPVKIFFMFQLVCIGWVFFRAENISHILLIFHRISVDLLNGGTVDMPILLKSLFFISIPFFVMFVHYMKERDSSFFHNKKYLSLETQPIAVRSISLAIITYLLCFYGAKAQSFIYFQF